MPSNTPRLNTAWNGLSTRNIERGGDMAFDSSGDAINCHVVLIAGSGQETGRDVMFLLSGAALATPERARATASDTTSVTAAARVFRLTLPLLLGCAQYLAPTEGEGHDL